MTDEMLNLLGDYFVSRKLLEKGWTFEEFLKEFQIGTITMG